ncbi:glycosyltransferase family 4 protein [Hymenobacter gelipurpurascens]|uniref:glycosyltransferase family 4 protein n=1 Tax=Hymenobacter gelipurpurascens TaxID=89968 RepID=UPI001482C184|nr:glycosyltransferase family 4 protein [Hymenobacter gelipurpurascens]
MHSSSSDFLPVVLLIDSSRAVTGALNAIRHATGPLQTQFRFIYVVPSGSTARPLLEQDGYLVHELPFVEISRRKAELLRYLPMLLLNGWRLHRLAKRSGAAIVHLNDFYNLTGYVAKLLSFGRLRVVTHVRFLPQSLPQPFARTWRWFGEQFSDRVLCVSEAVRRYFGAHYKVQVVFDPIPGKEQYLAPVVPNIRLDNTVQLLYLSNYIQGKGQDLAVRAFQRAYIQNDRLRLTFVGGDMGMVKNREFRQKLQDFVQANDLTDIVRFEGFVSDVEKVVKEADILLNFSESESFSLTCLDALYFGTPLIASDCGGPSELFEHRHSGWLVPNRDIAAMATAITTLAADATMRTRFAAAGRKFVRYKFRPAATYEKLGQVYREVIASR